MDNPLGSVTVDKQGRITLPKKARKKLRRGDTPLVESGDTLFVYRKGSVLLLGKDPEEIKQILNVSKEKMKNVRK